MHVFFLAKIVKESHSKWLKTPGKNGQTHKDTDMSVNSCDVDPPFLHDDPPKVVIKRKNLSWL